MYITADYLDVGPLCHDLEEDIMTSPQTERLQTKKEVHAPSLKCAAAHMDKPNAFWAKIYGQMKQRLRYLVTIQNLLTLLETGQISSQNYGSCLLMATKSTWLRWNLLRNI